MSGRSAQGLWSGHHLTWLINCLEILAVFFFFLKHFLPDLRGHNVLVRTDNTSVVSNINHQEGLRSRPLYRLAHQILLWAQGKLLSLGAVNIPGHLNQGADILSRQGLRSREWRFQIWRMFSQAEVDLFASQDTAHCLLWFSLTHPAPLGLDAMVKTWLRLRLYPFPPIALLPGILERVQRNGVHLLLVAPFWLGWVWFSDLMTLHGRFLSGGTSSLRWGAPSVTFAWSCGNCGCGPWGGTPHSFQSLSWGCWDHTPVQSSLYEKTVHPEVEAFHFLVRQLSAGPS